MSGEPFEDQMAQIGAVLNAHAVFDANRTRLSMDYAGGLVLFHKDRLRNLKEQLEAYNATRAQGTVLRIQDVWGATVDIPAMSGQLLPLTEQDVADNCDREM